MDFATFEQELILRGLENETVDYYLQKMRQICRACAPLSKESFKSFMAAQKRLGKKASSINKLLNVLRQYGDIMGFAWPKEIPFLQEEEPHKEIYSDYEIELMLNAPAVKYCDQKTWDRWTMWLMIMAFSGMRPSEAARLTIHNVEWGTNNFILDKTKTTPRRVPIATSLKEPLQKYLKDKTLYLFPVGNGKSHIKQQGWYKHMILRKKAAGITRPGLSAHNFRHSFITNIQEEGAPLQDVMRIVGHKRPETTLKYTHLGTKSIQKSVNRHSMVKKQADHKKKLEYLIEEATKIGILDDSLHFSYKITDRSVYVELRSKE